MIEPASRTNSFDVLRLLAAGFVFWSHQFALLGHSEPVPPGLKETYGGLGLYIFFAISGYLNTASLLASRSAPLFLASRALRIYPAVLVSTVVTMAAGAVVTIVPLTTYLGSYETVLFIVKNATLLAGAAQHLPGVFTHNPAQSAVNGSLWTLPYEIYLYLILAVVLTLVSFRGSIVILLLGVAIIIGTLHPHVNWAPSQLSWFVIFSVIFFPGATLAVFECGASSPLTLRRVLAMLTWI